MSEAAFPFEVFRGGAGVVLVAMPATWVGIELDETDGDTATAENFETGREVLARLGRVMVIVDGPMFDIVGGGTDYDRPGAKARLQYRYLDRRRGIDRPTRHADRGATISVGADGRAAVQSGALEVQGAVFAVQGYPELIRRGAVVIGTRDADRVGRAAFCVLADGRVGFAVGRAPMRAFAEAVLALPCRVSDAIYTDGGGSTTLGLRNVRGGLDVAQGLDARKLPIYLIGEPPPAGAGMVGAGGGGVVARWVPGPAARFFAAVALATVGAAAGAHWWRNRPPAEP